MRSTVGSRLPAFTWEKVRGSFDFIGFNHYLIMRVGSLDANSSQEPRDYYVDASVENSVEDIAKASIETAPWSLTKLLEHLTLNYGNPPVWIHENGMYEFERELLFLGSRYGDGPGTLSKAEYEDDDRTEFLQDYLEALYLSTRNGSNARGYFVWSFLDVFEFLFGYKVRFGLCSVDMSDEVRRRYVRSSARWFSGFLHGGELRPVQPEKSYVA